MKLRDLFKAFRHHEHESRCHELTDQERMDAVKRVDELLQSKSITGSTGSKPKDNNTASESSQLR
jgi:hypothetical protein